MHTVRRPDHIRRDEHSIPTSHPDALNAKMVQPAELDTLDWRPRREADLGRAPKKESSPTEVIMSEYTWYICFWVGMGVVALTPIYVLLYLILQRLN